MPSATSALYAPLIERDLDAIDGAARAFAAEHSGHELWLAVTRFAVLAHAPSMHAKRAVVACLAAREVEGLDLTIACARYAAESRQPWSEPPLLEPPHVDPSQPVDRAALRAAIDAHDRARAEQWLAARLDDAEADLRALAQGDALLLLETVLALEPHLGTKGRYALLRIVIAELLASPEPVDETLDVLVDRAIDAKGEVTSVSDVFVRAIALPPMRDAEPLAPYRLARDYAQTLIAHAIARRLPARDSEFLAAVHHHLEHGESYAEWSFA